MYFVPNLALNSWNPKNEPTALANHLVLVLVVEPLHLVHVWGKGEGSLVPSICLFLLSRKTGMGMRLGGAAIRIIGLQGPNYGGREGHLRFSHSHFPNRIFAIHIRFSHFISDFCVSYRILASHRIFASQIRFSHHFSKSYFRASNQIFAFQN